MKTDSLTSACAFRRHLIGGFCSLGIGVVSLILAIVLPIVVRNEFAKALKASVLITSEDSTYFDTWAHGSKKTPTYMKYYIFNVTNSEDVLKGDLPILEERGPYAYREHKNKNEFQTIETSEDLLLKYIPQTYYVWDEEASGDVSEDDVFTAPSCAFWAIDNIFREPDYVGYQPLLVSSSQNAFNSTHSAPFITQTMKKLMWGYEDPLFALLPSALGLPKL
eukprot:gene4325-5319_t